MEASEAKRQISALVEKYRDYGSNGKLEALSEADTRTIFIDPLFECLGWKMKDIEEVSREDRVSNGYVDYAFRISGVVRFFLEAKAAREDLGEKEAWQAINYAYFKSVPWAVLTNFRKLVIYSSEWKTRKSEDSRFLEFDIGEYVARFDELRLLGSESIAKGEIDAFAEKVGRKAKREPVSRALVEDLTRWRRMLGKNILKFDPRKKFTKGLLDEAVQRFLDRLIFIRTCEDRKFENERLRAAVREYKKSNRKLGGHVNEIFLEFRDNYDSDIFFPHMAGDLTLDNEVLEQVLTEMYESPDGVPYNFAHIDADILGNVYEQYLAMMAREGGGLQEKEMKRKEMGIYYTPTHIVDYIVKNTLGELIAKARSAEDLERIKILDPACGSGSFLIRAYEELYRAYVRKNNGDNEMLEGNMSRNANSILTRNIYGVDLDLKAVEIAELNLLLKAAVRQGLLPPLSDNIKNGNSLISGKEEELKEHFGSDWERKKPFNWEIEFKEVMDNGGFDVVMGNPPYLNVKRGFFQDEQEFLEAKYETARGQYDLYRLFIERGLQLLKDGGYLGFIIPRRSFTNENEVYLRRYLLERSNVKIIVDVGAVFDEASVEAGILIVQKGKPQPSNKIMRQRIDLVTKKIETLDSLPQNAGQQDKNITFNVQTSGKFERIIHKIRGNMLGEAAGITRGVEAGKSSEFVSEKPTEWPLIFGEDVYRYRIRKPDKWIRFSKKEPAVFKPETLYRQPKKILIRRVADEIISAIDAGQNVTLNTLYCLELKMKISPEYLCGLLNSKLINFWFKNKFVLTEKMFPYVRISQLEQIPIVVASHSDQENVAKLVDRMLNLNKKLFEFGETQTSERARTEEEIKRTDAEIDDLVYKIYGITDDERKTIEESTKRE